MEPAYCNGGLSVTLPRLSDDSAATKTLTKLLGFDDIGMRPQLPMLFRNQDWHTGDSYRTRARRELLAKTAPPTKAGLQESKGD